MSCHDGLSFGDATYFGFSIFMTSTNANDSGRKAAGGPLKLATASGSPGAGSEDRPAGSRTTRTL